MDTVTIYHNPTCSKSQEAPDYLEARGYRPRVIRYLETPLTESEIRALVRQLGIAPAASSERPIFSVSGLTSTGDSDQLIALIVKHPILMQRPIVVVGDRARIAKPPEVLAGFLPPAGHDDAKSK